MGVAVCRRPWCDGGGADVETGQPWGVRKDKKRASYILRSRFRCAIGWAMEAVLRYRGREVSEKDVAYIRSLIAANPGASRRRLSKELCTAWGWVQPNGHPKDMICRGLMLALHRAGHIELPPVRFKNHNPFVDRKRPEKALAPRIGRCDRFWGNGYEREGSRSIASISLRYS